MTVPAVLYAAKSTADPHGSIPTQLADGRVLATRNGWTVLSEFRDEGFSAYSGNRGPGLAAALAAAEAGAREHGTCHLIVQHSDRLARGDGKTATHVVEHALWALKADVTIESVQDPQTFADLLYSVVAGQRNAEDSRRKALAVKDGMGRRRAKGLHTGGPEKLGYTYVRDEYGRTVPDLPLRVVPAEAALVRRIFEEYVGGKTQQAIQRGLNAEGHTAKRGRRWHQGTVSNLLADAFYMGVVPDRATGELHPGQHPPIISEGLWRQAEALRLAGRKAEGGKRGRQPKGRHLLTNGHLRCGRCGAAMVPRTKGHYQAYQCYARVQDRANCDMPSVQRTDVDGPLVAYFQQVALDVEGTRREMIAATEHRVAEVRALREEADREAMRAAERLARVKRHYLDGKLDADDWRSFREELRAEQEAATARAETLASQEAAVTASGALEDAEEAVLRRLADLRAAVVGDVRRAGDVEALRAALARLFSRFVLHDTSGPNAPTRVHGELITDGARFLEPHVRPEVLMGYNVAVNLDTGEETQGSPRVQRVPLPSRKNDGVGVPNA
jgi:site-specific DNA recombinase